MRMGSGKPTAALFWREGHSIYWKIADFETKFKQNPLFGLSLLVRGVTPSYYCMYCMRYVTGSTKN